MNRETELIDIDLIEEDMRLREVREEAVKGLAASMADIGMRTPISVRYFPDKPSKSGTDDSYRIVTGAHRLAAARKLGWDKIECFIVECDEIDAELWEIAENLHRAELTSLERDEQVARWVELHEIKLSDKLSEKSRGRPAGGAAAASREFGINERDVQRAVKTSKLSAEAKEAAREVGLDDNRTALLEAAKAEPSRQATAIREIAQAKALRTEQDIQNRAAQEVAEILAEHVPSELWDGLKANIHAAGKINLILAAFNNLIGNAVMDRRYGA